MTAGLLYLLTLLSLVVATGLVILYIFFVVAGADYIFDELYPHQDKGVFLAFVWRVVFCCLPVAVGISVFSGL